MNVSGNPTCVSKENREKRTDRRCVPRLSARRCPFLLPSPTGSAHCFGRYCSSAWRRRRTRHQFLSAVSQPLALQGCRRWQQAMAMHGIARWCAVAEAALPASASGTGSFRFACAPRAASSHALESTLMPHSARLDRFSFALSPNADQNRNLRWQALQSCDIAPI